MGDKTGNEYYYKITYLQFALSLLVVLIHTYNVDVYGIDKTAFACFEQEISCISRIAVPTFFAISGFLFFKNYELSQTLNKWKRRLFSLCIPLVLWNILSYLYFLILSFIPIVSENMNIEIKPLTVLNVISIPFSIEYNNVSWYLVNLIVYLLFAPIIYLLLKNKYFGLIVMLGVPLVGCVISNNYLIQSMYFMFGAYFGIHFKNTVFKKASKKNSIIAIVVFVLLSQILFFIKRDTTDYSSNIILLLMMPAFWIATDYFDFKNEPKWWIKISFFIYMSHSFILEPIEKIIFIALGKSLFGCVFDYFAAPISTVFLIILLAYF